jgi:hypothetical protein
MSYRIYQISYDLHKEGQNYDGLIEEIKKSPGYIKILQSSWLIATTENAYQLCNRLRTKLDDNDSIFVSRVDTDCAGWLPQSVWDWIKESRKAA